jgi:hypothetical protein
MTQIRVPVSPEQEEFIVQFAASEDKQLGIYNDERHWMVAQARMRFPGCHVKAADLDIENGQWVLEIEERITSVTA